MNYRHWHEHKLLILFQRIMNIVLTAIIKLCYNALQAVVIHCWHEILIRAALNAHRVISVASGLFINTQETKGSRLVTLCRSVGTWELSLLLNNQRCR